jgi:hypothetical protein
MLFAGMHPQPSVQLCHGYSKWKEEWIPSMEMEIQMEATMEQMIRIRKERKDHILLMERWTIDNCIGAGCKDMDVNQEDKTPIGIEWKNTDC